MPTSKKNKKKDKKLKAKKRAAKKSIFSKPKQKSKFPSGARPTNRIAKK